MSNRAKLRGRIKEIYGTETAFAEAMNLSQTSISLKLNGIRKFDEDEIIIASKLLQIKPNEIGYFFI